MNTLLLTNFFIFWFISLMFTFFGTNVITKIIGILLAIPTIFNLVTYLQLVFPTVNWI